jgi:Insertion element 4 transposase N-terminal
LRTQSAIATITHTVTAAAGVYAPGHLGGLTQYLPFELVDDILEQTRTVQRRLRALPSRTGVYFLLALGMFPRLGPFVPGGPAHSILPGCEKRHGSFDPQRWQMCIGIELPRLSPLPRRQDARREENGPAALAGAVTRVRYGENQLAAGAGERRGGGGPRRALPR